MIYILTPCCLPLINYLEKEYIFLVAIDGVASLFYSLYVILDQKDTRQ